MRGGIIAASLLACSAQEAFVTDSSRLEALLRLKDEIHELSPEQAEQRIRELGEPLQKRQHQAKIEHFVIVYAENHGFNHMLGCLDLPGIDGIPKEGMQIPKDPDDPSASVLNITCGGAPYVCDNGPKMKNFHAFFKPGANYSYYPYGEQDVKYAAANGAKEGVTVQMMSPEQLPIKSTLARSFGVFNKLYSAVPGNSMPNHMMTQTGTSCGMNAKNVFPYNKCGSKLNPLYPQWSIYDQMHHDGVSYNIFFNGEDLVPPDAYMTGVLRHLRHWRTMSQFYRMAKKGKLPQFSWIVAGEHESDHPCHDIARGEAHHKKIYEALRNGPGWNKTLIAFLYDDPGGYFDHIVPPHEDVPADGSSCVVSAGCPEPFDFRRLGNRVTGLLVSPWIGKGAVFQEPKKGPTATSQFDLTSVISTTRSLFNLSSSLTKRDAWSASFEELLLDEMRSDNMPETLPDSPPFAPTVDGQDEDGDENDARAISSQVISEQFVERRLQADPVPQHCAAETGLCHGPGHVSVKQRRNIEILAHITQRPHPDVDAMHRTEAAAWLKEHVELLRAETLV